MYQPTIKPRRQINEEDLQKQEISTDFAPVVQSKQSFGDEETVTLGGDTAAEIVATVRPRIVESESAKQAKLQVDGERILNEMRDVKTIDNEIDEPLSVGQFPSLMPANAREMYERELNAYRNLESAPIKKTSRWKSGAWSGLLGLGKAFGGRSIRDWNDFAGASAEAGTYAAGGLINKKLGNTFKREIQLSQARQNLLQAQKNYETDIGFRTKEEVIENQRRDDARRETEFQQTLGQKTINEREKRDSRERTSRLSAIAGMFKNLPYYDPQDPRFAEITKSLGDVDLPITPKDSKKKIDLKQDQRTGAWTTVLTDPLTGKQEVRAVTGTDGQQLKTTPTVVMQGEYGILRQNDQQEFTAGENEKNRALRRQQLNDARSRFAELLKLRKNAQNLQALALDQRDKNAAAKAEKEARDLEIKINQVKANWKTKIGRGGFTQEDYDSLILDLPDNDEE